MSNGRDTLKQGRGRISHFFSDMKAKFKNPGFRKDLSVYGGIASLIPLGRAFKAGAGLLSGGFLAPAGKGKGMVNFGSNMIGAFRNTPTQYSSRLPKSMQAMFEAPKQYNPFNRYFTPQAVTTEKVVAKKNEKLMNNLIKSDFKVKSNFNPANQQTIRPLHRDGKVYDKKAINDAFKRYFNR